MNKGKIIKITEDIVYIGYENGSIKEIERSSIDFEPTLGDIVEIYGNIVVKPSEGKKKNKTKKIANLIYIGLSLIAIIIIFKLVGISSNSSKEAMNTETNIESSYSEEISSSTENLKDKSLYETVDINKWKQNQIPNGTHIKVKGTVLQEYKSSVYRSLKIAVDNTDNQIIVATILDPDYENPIHIGDSITLYGNSGSSTDEINEFAEGLELSDSVPFMIVFLYEN